MHETTHVWQLTATLVGMLWKCVFPVYIEMEMFSTLYTLEPISILFHFQASQMPFLCRQTTKKQLTFCVFIQKPCGNGAWGKVNGCIVFVYNISPSLTKQQPYCALGVYSEERKNHHDLQVEFFFFMLGSFWLAWWIVNGLVKSLPLSSWSVIDIIANFCSCLGQITGQNLVHSLIRNSLGALYLNCHFQLEQ